MKLVFIETQVYFQCDKLVCMEMVSAPPAGIIDLSLCSANSDWKVFHHHEDNSTVIDLYVRISEYRTRKLTYKSDPYKAFLGIFHNFSSVARSSRKSVRDSIL
jgi:hypothetical protein